MTSTSGESTKRLPKKTVAFLKAIRAEVLKDARHYTQESFCSTGPRGDNCGCLAFIHVKTTRSPRTLAKYIRKEMHTISPADSPFYVAAQNPADSPFYFAAQKDLDLTPSQTKRLFGSISNWPFPFRIQYARSESFSKLRARVAAKRITHFIKTNGTDGDIAVDYLI